MVNGGEGEVTESTVYAWPSDPTDRRGGPFAAKVTPGTVGSIDATAEVRDANRRFYEAFEQRDLDAMSDLWERSARATCTHPGWATLRGWGPIAASFFALFQGQQQLQFVLTQERVEVLGDTGWATVDENLLGAEGGTTVAALNLFVRNPDE